MFFDLFRTTNKANHRRSFLRRYGDDQNDSALDDRVHVAQSRGHEESSRRIGSSHWPRTIAENRRPSLSTGDGDDHFRIVEKIQHCAFGHDAHAHQVINSLILILPIQCFRSAPPTKRESPANVKLFYATIFFRLLFHQRRDVERLFVTGRLPSGSSDQQRAYGPDSLGQTRTVQTGTFHGRQRKHTQA